jgi:hypothetical protein
MAARIEPIAAANWNKKKRIGMDTAPGAPASTAS